MPIVPPYPFTFWQTLLCGEFSCDDLGSESFQDKQIDYTIHSNDLTLHNVCCKS